MTNAFFSGSELSVSSDAPISTADFHLKYHKSFDFDEILAFLRPRLIRGVEIISRGKYARTFRTKQNRGWFSVGCKPEDSALELHITSENGRCFMELCHRVRRMFDLDTDFTSIHRLLGSDPLLAGGMTGGRVPRLPVAYDPFEFSIRAILGQQITVKAATTLAGRITEQAGLACDQTFPEGLNWYFPSPEELSQTPIDGLGVTGTRQETIRTVTKAVIDGRLSFAEDQSPEEFEKRFSALRGIGDWTVQYVAMRGLGMTDAFPASDLGIIKAFTAEEGNPSIREIVKAAEKWRPYRSYAALCLWNLSRNRD